MRRWSRAFSEAVLALLIFGSALAAMWLGLLPQRYSPFSPISLEEEPGWFLDAKLAVLRHDVGLCQSVLKAPHIAASPISDSPLKDGCGWVNAVRFSSAGGAEIGADKLTCEMAAALTLWIEHEVQPRAEKLFGERVARIKDMGTYDCRNILGNPLLKNVRSQHARANAIDISAFVLTGGRQISVLKDWSGAGPEAQFLREIHAQACHYFRVALGPNYNAAHKNHFHFDRGVWWRCK